jgi:hypothetical protein
VRAAFTAALFSLQADPGRSVYNGNHQNQSGQTTKVCPSFAQTRMERARLTLFHTLIAKSLAETCFVGILALGFFVTVFPPHLRGWGEAAPTAIAGWVVDDGAPWERVGVQLYIDGHFVANGVANLSRRDVLEAGMSKDEWHGFAFALPSLGVGTHEARVYADHAGTKGSHKTQQLVGNAILFSVDKTGNLTDLSAAQQ